MLNTKELERIANHPYQSHCDWYTSILSVLYRADPSKFVPYIGKRIGDATRLHFSYNQEDIELSGKSKSYPKLIPGTSLYAMTNMNIDDKSKILEMLMNNLDCPANVIDAVLSTPQRSKTRKRKLKITDKSDEPFYDWLTEQWI